MTELQNQVTWERADVIPWEWFDTSCGFECPHCGTPVVISVADDLVECDCGRQYRLQAFVEVRVER